MDERHTFTHQHFEQLVAGGFELLHATSRIANKERNRQSTRERKMA